MAVAALGWTVLLGLLTLWRDRAVQAQLEEMRARLWAVEQDSHTHRRWNHEPAVGRLLAGEAEASARRGES